MTRKEAYEIIKEIRNKICSRKYATEQSEAFDMALELLEQETIDKSAMMCEIYMKGVNMTDEYQGCWVRFKDIEKIVNKYITESHALQEPKTGQWISEPNCWLRCSICGNHYPHVSIYETNGFNYCPNCGAKMESEVL